MSDIYKMIIRADDYPDTEPRFYKLQSGDSFVIRDELNIVNPLEQYKDYPAFIKSIIYSPKKWWQFWKKKRQLGYVVEWK